MMAYDDVANACENPFPGQLYNKPDGPDVYKGCKIDYKGDDVTPSKFIAVLEGDEAKAKGKVLKSTKDSKVFVYYSDHGGSQLIAFPNGEFLYADDLNTVLKKMHDEKKYQRLVFYLEACESGSMFEYTLPKDIDVYAVTASNATESSWATYCPPDDVVKGTHL
jgi:legumain